jgi:hypothetical protein
MQQNGLVIKEGLQVLLDLTIRGFLQNVQIGFGVHPASCSVGTGNYFPGEVKRPGYIFYP